MFERMSQKWLGLSTFKYALLMVTLTLAFVVTFFLVTALTGHISLNSLLHLDVVDYNSFWFNFITLHGFSVLLLLALFVVNVRARFVWFTLVLCSTFSVAILSWSTFVSLYLSKFNSLTSWIKLASHTELALVYQNIAFVVVLFAVCFILVFASVFLLNANQQLRMKVLVLLLVLALVLLFDISLIREISLNHTLIW